MTLTISGETPAANNSVVPPIRKQWPVVLGYPWMDQIELHLRRKVFFVKIEGPFVDRKENNR